MRRFIVCLALAMLLSTSAVFAGALRLAAPVQANRQFEKYQSYKQTAADWSAHDLTAAHILRKISAGSARNFMGSGACMLYPSVRGDLDLGLTEVILNVCLFRSQALAADSVSIVAGGHRYDFVATPRRTNIGNYACELFELPLNQQGMDLLSAIADGGCSVSVYSATRFYRTTIVPDSEDLTAKQRFEAESIEAVRSLLTEIDMDAYNLWELNQARWADKRPLMACVALTGAPSEGQPWLDAVFCQLMSDNAGAVRWMQQLLRDTSFYAGTIDGRYGANTRAAIREAQRYYGLMESGQADGVLVDCLNGNQGPTLEPALGAFVEFVEPGQAVQANEGVMYRSDGIAQVRIDRYWAAHKLSPSAASTPTPQPTGTPQPAGTPSPTAVPVASQSITPASASNLLLIFDGELTNLAASERFLPLSVQAEVTLNSQYTFPCQVRCESAAGSAFATQLLPLETARLLLYAEIPEAAALDIEALFIQIDAMALRFDVGGMERTK